jgi:hypothetical protein
MVQDVKPDQARVEILIASILTLALLGVLHFVIEIRYALAICLSRARNHPATGRQRARRPRRFSPAELICIKVGIHPTLLGVFCEVENCGSAQEVSTFSRHCIHTRPSIVSLDYYASLVCLVDLQGR